ncbi:MAG: sel1 repeat family protein [Rhodobacteraceae bacterium]|nr:sel1 repeat family protein [Paracoccaceae bacterium]
MTGFMNPPVADEPAPRNIRVIVFTVVALVIIIAAAFRLGRPPEFDETSVTLVIPATTETFDRGLDLFLQRDWTTAYTLLRPHADAGNSDAQLIMGWMFGYGFRGKYLVDHCKAAVWLDKSARQGNPVGMARLAEYYFRGAGVVRDPSKGYLWYREATAIRGNDPDSVTRGFKAFVEKQPYGYVSFPNRDTEAYKDPGFMNWDFHREPPVEVAPLPDIPIIDLIVQVAGNNRQGCHAAPNWSFSDFPGTLP